MKRITVLCGFLLLFFGANACLNIFAVDSSGRVHYLEHHFFFSVEFNYSYIGKQLKKLDKEFKRGKYNYQNISDYGAYLLMAGHFAEGLELSRALLKKYPDIYEVRSNAAVAYELNGQPDSALYWLNAALRLNPESHEGSEWVHRKILEARLQLQKDPNWCLLNDITGVVDSVQKTFKIEEHEGGNYLWVFMDFIRQLEERFSFTFPEDKVMGKLMFELGDAYQLNSVYRSYYCYAIAGYLYPDLKIKADEKMRLIRKNYPVPKEEGRRSPIQREERPPDENETIGFVNRLIERRVIRTYQFNPVRMAVLLEKLK